MARVHGDLASGCCLPVSAGSLSDVNDVVERTRFRWVIL